MGVIDPRTGATTRRQLPTPAQALELAREAEELAGQLGSAALELHRIRNLTSTPDAYRSPSRFDLGMGHGGGGHGDPVGELVAAEFDADLEGKGRARRAYRETVTTLEAVVVLLRSGAGAARAVLHPAPIAGPEDQGCTSHAAHGFLHVDTRTPGSDLCRWCADFWRKFKQRPSLADLQALEESRVEREVRKAA